MSAQPHRRLAAVGRQILIRRKQLGLSRAEFARAAGVSASSVARIERGEEVRLSTYLAIVDHIVGRGFGDYALAERIVMLSGRDREQLTTRLRELERGATPDDDD